MRNSVPNSRPAGIDQVLIQEVPDAVRDMYILDAFCSRSVPEQDTKVRVSSYLSEPMRVIAGQYRSRPLQSLRGMDIRPTSDRLRETLFDVLCAGNPEALRGTVWIDLYAGTGAVGVEALSRGAAEVTF